MRGKQLDACVETYELVMILTCYVILEFERGKISLSYDIRLSYAVICKQVSEYETY